MRSANQSTTEVILEARNITKRYPGNVALDGVTFRAYCGQVNVLIGENGAGKSTLMRILAGAENADEGTLLLEGRPVLLRTPRDASAHGISIVHQELLALTNLRISENIFAGRELCHAGLFIDQAAQDQRSAAALRQLRKPMDVATETGRLSLGCRQVVEIARALDQGSRILILDEPTSALSTSETESLFEVISDLKHAGVTIIYISHRLHELLHLGDRFTVLRSGRVVGEATRADATRAWIVERMSGRKEGAHEASTANSASRPTVLTVSGLTLPARLATKPHRRRYTMSASLLAKVKFSESTDCWERGEPSWWKRWPDCGRSRRGLWQFADKRFAPAACATH